MYLVLSASGFRLWSLVCGNSQPEDLQSHLEEREPEQKRYNAPLQPLLGMKDASCSTDLRSRLLFKDRITPLVFVTNGSG